MMEIIITDRQEKFDYEVAMQIVNLIKGKPNAVIGLATGNTPKGMYTVLANTDKKKAKIVKKALMGKK